jgi:hypothetical protein
MVYAWVTLVEGLYPRNWGDYYCSRNTLFALGEEGTWLV